MFSEREQTYLKALSVSMLQVMKDKDFSKFSPPEVADCFNQYLDDFPSHNPLSDCSDTEC